MALTKCKECSREVSSKAESCPQCGAPIKAKPRGTDGIGCGGLVIVGIVVLIIYGSISSPTTTSSSARPADPIAGARYACREFIQHQLNDPGSAQFGRIMDWPASQQEDGTILVRAGFRAKNAFNATIYTTWSCRVRNAEGDIRLVALEQISP